jgi:uroporphyrinogen decarboxylase
MEIETRDELVAASLGIAQEAVGWPERVRYALDVGMDAVGFAHWERFGCEVVHEGGVLGFIPQIASRVDMDKFMMPELIDFAALRERVLRAHEAIGQTGLALFVAHVLCLDPVIMDMGLENFSVALYEDREFLHELFRRYSDYYRALDEFYSTMPEIDFIWVGEDIAYNTGTIISPQLMRELVFPYFRDITGSITKPWVYHSDGNITEVIPDLLELGMSAIHPLEPAVMDIRMVKKQYGQQVTLVGNIDITTLTLSSQEVVQQEVQAVMDGCSVGGRYILSSGNSLTNYVLPANVRAMGQAKKAWNNDHGFGYL